MVTTSMLKVDELLLLTKKYEEKIRKSVEEGKIALSRYNSYLGLLDGEEKYRN